MQLGICLFDSVSGCEKWPERFPLYDHSAGEQLASVRHVAHRQADEVAASELAVDHQVEHGEVAHRVRIL